MAKEILPLNTMSNQAILISFDEFEWFKIVMLLLMDFWEFFETRSLVGQAGLEFMFLPSEC